MIVHQKQKQEARIWIYIQFQFCVIRLNISGLKYTFCLHWEKKGHGLRVNLVKREALLKDLYAIRVLAFISQYK